MERLFLKQLKAWEDNNIKEPVLVIGARQVGKTWTIKNFCDSVYDDYIYMNLEEDEGIITLFEDTLKPSEIIKRLGIYFGRAIEPGKTALIFDEIQKSERIINSLKYFCESDENYRVIGAGSLLGVKLKRYESSFPVGKLHILHMYPMTFREFLTACGEEMLADLIEESVSSLKTLPDAIHQKANTLYRNYLYVGGMPAAVRDYISCGQDVMKFNRDIHKNIILSYLADMTKYTMSPAEGVKINEVYQSVPKQLARENPKFKYKEVRQNGSKRDLSSSLDWLYASGMVIKSANVKMPVSPLPVYEDPGSFKAYLSDVGLLSTMSGIKYHDLSSETHNIYKGAIAENYVVQMFTAAYADNYYFKPGQDMEIDQLFDADGEIWPIEIKSGRHKRSTSLKNYDYKYAPKRMYCFSENNFGKTKKLYSLPLYAVCGWLSESVSHIREDL